MRAASGVWRWRRNPLRRATDLVEAWTALLAALLLVTAAPAVGWFAGSATEDSLRQSARQQRLQRHPVTATVLGPLSPAGAPVYTPDSPAAREKPRLVRARWTAVDGGSRTGSVPTTLRDPRPGDRLTVWTDTRGRTAPLPLEPSAVRVHAVLGGLGAAFVCAGLVEALRRLIVRWLSRRRFARLDRAWAATGPDWGRTGTGG
ncbi:hypothetical protein [Streptomyces sp. NPDC001985]|uniref:Rv1733c family protein n=1 Tax=Streptomyces sp. NPDC001985 TaxID=3154406 RepID=UPI003326F08C